MKRTLKSNAAVKKKFKEILVKDTNHEVSLSRGILILTEMRQKWPKKKLAVVFDIDDTALMIDKKNIANAKVMRTFRKLYEVALALGYSVFFITARPDFPENRKFTLKQLVKHNFGRYTKLFMMPEGYARFQNFSPYKFKRRKEIAKNGYKIVLNVGDQWPDLGLMQPYSKKPNVVDYFDADYTQDRFYFIIDSHRFDPSLYGIKLPNKK